jgi:hypothetical protein
MVSVVAASSCARDSAASAARERQFEFGAMRVVVTVPTGWEALDQGRQKRFRKGEFEIVLQNLGSRTPPPGDPAAPEGAAHVDELVDWGLAAVGHDQRRDVKSRRAVTVDGREAMDIETWNRLDHTNPQRILLVRDEGDLLTLHTVGMAVRGSLAAFDAIRDSLHFVSARR